ncbi:SCO1664 family protein [Candidatus Oscillochloris fontis]|uniref:SCO1664 family protein n=1 Tax=Candidatus Oscillochloris fontis TaxID=2496868 RepID=UPI00101D2E91|nr:SCO1664 family protein [Candidatus Oscillochloris fontis]
MDEHLLDPRDACAILTHGEMEVVAAMPYSSNYTLLCVVEHAGMQVLGIYKPQRGERPLWDFPSGTLYQREVAAYLLSEALGLGFVPPTVLREGPYGVGMLQLFIEHDEEAHLFTMLKEGSYEAVIRQLCAFDALINNADRKSGHALKGLDGHLWAIDHGICFHDEPKLRTVLWDFIGEPLPAEVLESFGLLQQHLTSDTQITRSLGHLLAPDEVRALQQRLEDLITQGCFPPLGPGPNVPWPPV